MWIFTETGFVSAVKKPRDNGLVSLRARDLDSLRPFTAAYGVEIINTPNGDYPWRTFVTNSQLADWLAKAALDLDYDNFKSRVHKVHPGTKFINALHDVWAVMTRTEDVNARAQR